MSNNGNNRRHSNGWENDRTREESRRQNGGGGRNYRGRHVMRYLLWTFIILLTFLFVFYNSNPKLARTGEYTYSQFQSDVKEKGDKIEDMIISPNRETPTGQVKVYWSDKRVTTLYTTDVNKVADWLDSIGYTKYKESDIINREGWLYQNGALIILGGIFLWFLFSFINAQQNLGGGGNNKMMDFGKSRAVMNDESTGITFQDVAGLQEEKEDLQEIVDFLRRPAKYTKVGARIPKGVILTGPPGTGKTLLAKAVAGEAGVPFFSISGSDFVEMFVGVGASRVRDLFDKAKKNSPCIVFIDEIDAVARRRGTGLGGGHDEREQTLNQLLVEMDGFGVNEGIIVMAATNRVDILDPAILRPGRFDRKVAVGRPDIQGRRDILAVHTRNKPLGDDVDLDQIARTTAGFSGADLENLVNEAAIGAARDDRAFITQEDLRKAFVKVGIGDEKKSRVISEKEKKITAYHESGHAILFHLLPDVGPVYTVSIIPTGMGAAGYTMPLPEKDEMFYTKGKMLQQITVSLGGRVAEELIFHDITTGASQDIKQATAMARAMVTQYGMSDEVGLINYDNDSNNVFIGYDLAHSKTYGENTASMIDSEVKKIIDGCHKEARRIIGEHMDVLHASADLLLEKEKITREEFEALFSA